MTKRLAILIGILLLGSILRLYQLGTVPLGLFGDEIDAGYNAFSFLKTGKDYNGNFLPIHFESMGDYRPFGFILALVPSIAILGLNDFSVRLVPAVWGILGVVLIYLLTWRGISTKLPARNATHSVAGGPISNYYLPLLAALLLAITPWHVHYSRAAFEATLMLSLLLLGVYALLKSINHSRWLFLSTFSFAYVSYTYNITKLYASLLLLLTLFIYRRSLLKIPSKILIINGFLYLLFLSPLIYQTLNGTGQTRFQDINLLNTPGLTQKINIARGQIPTWAPFLQQIFHNKAVSVGYHFINNYFTALSPDYIFVKGEINNPRHSLPGFGLLFWWMAPLFFLGLYQVWKHQSHPFMQLLFLWLITAPLPSALTLGGGEHATRLFIMLPPLIIITAIGINNLFGLLRTPMFPFLFSYQPKLASKTWMPIIMSIMLILTGLVSLTYYLQNYYFHYSLNHYRFWQFGIKPALQFAFQNQDRYDHIIITTNFVHLPMLYYLFYSQYDPDLLHHQFSQQQQGIADDPSYQINKYIFTTYNSGDVTQPLNSLYIAVPEDYNPVWHVIGQLNSPDLTDDKPLLLYLSSE